MLLDYSFKNFCSFKEEAKFSLRATLQDEKRRLPDNYVAGKVDGLKTAVIIGENAGGKSNFIRSLWYLKNFFQANKRVFSSELAINDHYAHKNRNVLQSFSIKVLLKGAVYFYKLSIDANGIKSESLSVKEGNARTVEVFSVRIRKDGFIITGDVSNVLKSFGASNRGYGLSVSKLALIGVESAVAFSDWINDTLCVNWSPFGSHDLQHILDKFPSDDLSIIKDARFINLLRFIDPCIDQVLLDEKEPLFKSVIVRKDGSGEQFYRELINDSAGLRDYFAWAIEIFKVVYQNKVVFVDEVDRSLNPILADKIISFIHGSEHSGQFVFTTHNVMHLDRNRYMREQIYFVTKNLSTLTSEMYSFADFEDIDFEEHENIYDYYLRGILGGTPNG